MFEPADPVTTAPPPPPPPRGSGAKTGILIAILILLAGACVYLFVQTRDLRADLDKTQDSLAAEVASLKEQSAITAESSHRTVERLRDQLETARRQASMAAGQAKTDALKNIEDTRKKLEAAQALQAQQMNSQISEVKQTTDTKFSAVGTEVSGVKSDVASTKSELEKTIADLKRTAGDVDGQGVLIATNGKELAALRALGERNYFEFKLNKSKSPQKVGDILLQLKKADPKHNRYTLEVTADDKKVEKKDRNINEPLQFYTSKARQPYEIVVNAVQKNEVAGYLSTPKVQNQRN